VPLSMGRWFNSGRQELKPATHLAVGNLGVAQLVEQWTVVVSTTHPRCFLP
jgi:hypothetical protein